MYPCIEYLVVNQSNYYLCVIAHDDNPNFEYMVTVVIKIE